MIKFSVFFCLLLITLTIATTIQYTAYSTPTCDDENHSTFTIEEGCNNVTSVQHHFESILTSVDAKLENSYIRCKDHFISLPNAKL